MQKFPDLVKEHGVSNRQNLRQVRTMPSAFVGHAEVPGLGQGTRSKHVTDKISDKLEQCRLLLLAVRKFPDLVKEDGVSNRQNLREVRKMPSCLVGHGQVPRLGQGR